MVNTYLLLAALVAIAAVSLHVYTFEVWIWPNLKVEAFPKFPFGGPNVVMGFYRTVWHFFTVNWLMTIVICIMVGVGTLVPYGMLFIYYLMIFWLLIVVEIFLIAALSLKPGESYIKTMIKAFQWVIILVMVFFMYLGTKYQV
jgi:hypothetical protein